MRMLTCILLLLFAGSFYALSQRSITHSLELRQRRIDSIRNILPESHGKERIRLLNELGAAFRYLNDDSAQAILWQAYKEASVAHDLKQMSRSLRRLAWLEQNLDHLKKARTLAIRAVDLAKKSRDDETLALAFRQLGGILYGLNDNVNALHVLDSAEAILKKMKMDNQLSAVYLHKGNIYVKMNRMYDGLKYLNQSVRLEKRTGSPDNEDARYADAFHGIGEIYHSMHEYPTALSYYRQSIATGEPLRLNIPGSSYHKTGNIYLETGKYDSALFYYDQSIATINSRYKDAKAKKAFIQLPLIKKGEVYNKLQQYDTALQILLPVLDYYRRLNHTGRIIQVLPKVGVAYAGKQQYEKALQYGRELMTLAGKNNVQSGSRNAYDLLTTVFEKMNRKDSAFHYLKLASVIKDSIAMANLNSNMTFYKAMTENEGAEAKIVLLNKDNQIKQQRLNILIGSLSAFLLISITGLRFITLKRKNEANRRTLLENELQIQKLENEKKQAFLQQRAAELEMKALRSQMNPHFIFNCLNAINHFVLKNETETASDYLTRFSRLIRMVLQNSSRKNIQLSDELDMLKLYIELERVRFNNRFYYSINVDKEVDCENVMIPPLLLQPFVENAIWHGLMHKEGPGELTIDITGNNGMLCCTVTDNGVGRQDRAAVGNHALMHKKSMGMQITASRLKLLLEENGKNVLSVIDLKDMENNACGTKVIVQIPIAEPEANEV